jgi:hypothetical protein
MQENNSQFIFTYSVCVHEYLETSLKTDKWTSKFIIVPVQIRKLLYNLGFHHCLKYDCWTISKWNVVVHPMWKSIFAQCLLPLKASLQTPQFCFLHIPRSYFCTMWCLCLFWHISFLYLFFMPCDTRIYYCINLLVAGYCCVIQQVKLHIWLQLISGAVMK